MEVPAQLFAALGAVEGRARHPHFLCAPCHVLCPIGPLLPLPRGVAEVLPGFHRFVVTRISTPVPPRRRLTLITPQTNPPAVLCLPTLLRTPVNAVPVSQLGPETGLILPSPLQCETGPSSSIFWNRSELSVSAAHTPVLAAGAVTTAACTPPAGHLGSSPQLPGWSAFYPVSGVCLRLRDIPGIPLLEASPRPSPQSRRVHMDWPHPPLQPGHQRGRALHAPVPSSSPVPAVSTGPSA